MRRIIFLVLCCASVSKGYAQQAYCQQNHSKLVCGFGELEYLNHLGELQLQGTKIKHSLHVTGDLQADNASFARTNILGSAVIQHSNFMEFTDITGEAKIIDSMVNQLIELTGNAYLMNNHFVNNLKIKGDLYSKNNWYQNKASVKGKLKSEHDHFEKELEIQTCQLEMSETKAKGIHMLQQNNCANKQQNVVLKGRSHIDGDIVFEGNDGVVWLGTEAKMNGKVVGGNLQQKAQ